MGVYKYTGKKGVTYGIDFYFNGERVREKVGPNKKEAQEALGKRLREIRDGKFFGPAGSRPVLFREIADEYEKIAKEKKSYSVAKYYIKLVRSVFDDRLISEITSLDVERFKSERKATPTRGKKNRTGTSVNRELACLRAMLSKAVEWEIIERNPGSRVKDFPEPPGRNDFLSVEEAGRLLDACHPHLKPVVLCALETGMRMSETLGLRWSEIRNGMIYLTADRTKNGKPREVPVSDRLAAELKRLRTAQGNAPVALLTDLVFRPPRVRKAMRRGRVEVVSGPMIDIRVAWETAKKKAGIAPGFRLHDLRHTFASHQKMNGTDDFTLMELLGHSDFIMMKRYAHLTPEHKRRAINSLPEWGICKVKDGPQRYEHDDSKREIENGL
jgi:integrase